MSALEYHSKRTQLSLSLLPCAHPDSIATHLFPTSVLTHARTRLPIERLTCLHAQHVRMHRMCAHETRARASKHALSWRDYTHKLLYSENKALNLNKNNLVEFFRPNQCYPALLHHHAWTLTHLCGQGKDRA